MSGDVDLDRMRRDCLPALKSWSFHENSISKARGDIDAGKQLLRSGWPEDIGGGSGSIEKKAPDAGVKRMRLPQDFKPVSGFKGKVINVLQRGYLCEKIFTGGHKPCVIFQDQAGHSFLQDMLPSHPMGHQGGHLGQTQRALPALPIGRLRRGRDLVTLHSGDSLKIQAKINRLRYLKGAARLLAIQINEEGLHGASSPRIEVNTSR